MDVLDSSVWAVDVRRKSTFTSDEHTTLQVAVAEGPGTVQRSRPGLNAQRGSEVKPGTSSGLLLAWPDFGPSLVSRDGTTTASGRARRRNPSTLITATTSIPAQVSCPEIRINVNLLTNSQAALVQTAGREMTEDMTELRDDETTLLIACFERTMSCMAMYIYAECHFDTPFFATIFVLVSLFVSSLGVSSTATVGKATPRANRL